MYGIVLCIDNCFAIMSCLSCIPAFHSIKFLFSLLLQRGSSVGDVGGAGIGF